MNLDAGIMLHAYMGYSVTCFHEGRCHQIMGLTNVKSNIIAKEFETLGSYNVFQCEKFKISFTRKFS